MKASKQRATQTGRARRSRELGWLVVLVAGCAVEANTLEPVPSDGTSGKAGQGTAGSASGGGGKAGAGPGKSTGGNVSNAFGGTGTTSGEGGEPGASGNGGSATEGGSQAGGMASAGQGGSGGKASGGGGGNGAGQGGGGASSAGNGGGGASGSAGSAGSAGKGGGGSGGGGDHCLVGWRDNAACDTCSTQTQGDKKACANVLDCFIANDCGPATCAGNTQVCGANAIQQGAAPYPIAQDVYDCVCL